VPQLVGKRLQVCVVVVVVHGAECLVFHLVHPPAPASGGDCFHLS